MTDFIKKVYEEIKNILITRTTNNYYIISDHPGAIRYERS